MPISLVQHNYGFVQSGTQISVVLPAAAASGNLLIASGTGGSSPVAFSGAGATWAGASPNNNGGGPTGDLSKGTTPTGATIGATITGGTDGAAIVAEVSGVSTTADSDAAGNAGTGSGPTTDLVTNALTTIAANTIIFVRFSIQATGGAWSNLTAGWNLVDDVDDFVNRQVQVVYKIVSSVQNGITVGVSNSIANANWTARIVAFPFVDAVPLSWAPPEPVLMRMRELRRPQLWQAGGFGVEGTVVPVSWAPIDSPARMRELRRPQWYQTAVAAVEGTVIPLAWNPPQDVAVAKQWIVNPRQHYHYVAATEATVLPDVWAPLDHPPRMREVRRTVVLPESPATVLQQGFVPVERLQFQAIRPQSKWVEYLSTLQPEVTVTPLSWAPQEGPPKMRDARRMIWVPEERHDPELTVTPLSWLADESRPRMRTLRPTQLIQPELERMVLPERTVTPLSWAADEARPRMRSLIVPPREALQEWVERTLLPIIVPPALSWMPIELGLKRLPGPLRLAQLIEGTPGLLPIITPPPLSWSPLELALKRLPGPLLVPQQAEYPTGFFTPPPATRLMAVPTELWKPPVKKIWIPDRELVIPVAVPPPVQELCVEVTDSAATIEVQAFAASVETADAAPTIEMDTNLCRDEPDPVTPWYPVYHPTVPLPPGPPPAPPPPAFVEPIQEVGPGFRASRKFLLGGPETVAPIIPIPNPPWVLPPHEVPSWIVRKAIWLGGPQTVPDVFPLPPAPPMPLTIPESAPGRFVRRSALEIVMPVQLPALPVMPLMHEPGGKWFPRMLGGPDTVVPIALPAAPPIPVSEGTQAPPRGARMPRSNADLVAPVTTPLDPPYVDPLVQANKTAFSNTNVVRLNFKDFPVQPGHDLTVHLFVDGSANIQSVAGGGVNTWTPFSSPDGLGIEPKVSYGLNTMGESVKGTQYITVTLTQPDTGEIVIAEWSGCVTTEPAQDAPSGSSVDSSGTSATPATGALTIQNTCLLIAQYMMATPRQPVSAPTNGFILDVGGRTVVNDGSASKLATTYAIKAPGAQSPTQITDGASGLWFASLVTLRRIVVVGTRDPATRPFAKVSPWNQPIGSNATYAVITTGYNAPGDVTTTGYGTLGFKLTCGGAVWVGKSTDPLRNYKTTLVNADGSASDPGFTFVYDTNTFQINVSDSALVDSGCSDLAISLISADHLTCLESLGTARQGDQSFLASGGWIMHLDTKGPGWGGNARQGVFHTSTHFPSGTFSPAGITTAAFVPFFAGVIRPGEMVNGINHAMALVTAGATKNRNPPGGGNGGNRCVWPAFNADAQAFDGSLNAPDKYANFGNAYMGSLMAIPASFSIPSLGLQTQQGINIANALQQYGAYVVDTGAGQLEAAIKVEMNAWGDVPTSAAFLSDMAAIVSHIQVVTNGFAGAAGTDAYGNATTTASTPRTGFKIDLGDGTVNPVLLAPPFASQYGGGDGRGS